MGKLGTHNFLPGMYLYVGSALKNLERRIARHRAEEKRFHWHIDFLLQFAVVENILTIESENHIECLLNQVVSETLPVRMVMRGFGSSDCPCPTHLWRGDFSEYQNGRDWQSRIEAVLSPLP